MSGDERTARSLAASSGRTVRNADQVQFRTRRNLRKTIEGQITNSKTESPVAISTGAISAFQSYCLARSRSFTSHQQHTAGVLRLTNRNFRVCRAAPDGNKHGDHIQLASQIHRQKSRKRSGASSVYLTVCWMFRWPRVCREDQDKRAWLMMTMTPLTIGTIFGGISSSQALSR
jgi:hypothetical protein